MLYWSTSGIYAAAPGKVALCIMRVLWTDDSSRQDKPNIMGKIDHMHGLKTKPDGEEYCSSTLTLFGHQWEPTESPIDSTLATYKYLGVHFDLHCKNNDAFERGQIKAAAMLSYLLT
jgi:hypothetical protein